jgi:spore maturation protein CgeB
LIERTELIGKTKRILIVADLVHKPAKMFLTQAPKLAKGFIRLGHDVRQFSYFETALGLSPVKNRTFARLFAKNKADGLLVEAIKNYRPDIIFITFVRVFDVETVEQLRRAAPNAVFVGFDVDAWPQLRPGRIEIAKKLDILLATNDGEYLQTYRDAGVPKCVFMPNSCDPDTDRRYDIEEKWKKDILWTGLVRHDVKRYPGEQMRYEIINRLVQMPNCAVYGCCGRPKIGGMDYLYAISGAKIGLSINGDNTVRLYHSDRLTNYLSCGAYVLAKRVPDSDLLFKNGLHLRYFDTAEEFFELADWYLKHEDERKKIADAGMKWTHEQYNSVKIAGYILDLVEKGTYNAPWAKNP